MKIEIKKIKTIEKIMNENLKTVSYSIVFLSDIVSNENLKNKKSIEYSEKDDIFINLNSDLLGVVLRYYNNDENIEIEEKDETTSPIEKIFEVKNYGISFRYQKPYKLSISYIKSKGKLEKPDEYIKGLANELIKTLKKKSKIYKVGINYEMFFPIKKNEEFIKNNLIKQYIENNQLENAFLKLSYKIDTFTKLYLSITSAKNENEEGLFFGVNFECLRQENNSISEILSNDNRLLEKSVEVIEKLIDLKNVK